MKEKDPYAVLGVQEGDDEAVIRRAYRKKLFEHHPDYGGSAKQFMELRAAYEELSKSDEAGRYDAPSLVVQVLREESGIPMKYRRLFNIVYIIGWHMGEVEATNDVRNAIARLRRDGIIRRLSGNHYVLAEDYPTTEDFILNALKNEASPLGSVDLFEQSIYAGRLDSMSDIHMALIKAVRTGKIRRLQGRGYGLAQKRQLPEGRERLDGL